MPSSVVAMVVSSVVTDWAATTFASMMLGRIVGAIAGFVVSGILRSATSEKPDKPQSNTATSSRDRTTTVRQPISPRQVIYGEVRTAGVMTFVEVVGSKLYIVITFAGHPVKEIGPVYFNDERIDLDSTGAATGRFAGYARVWKSLGDEGSPQQPFPDLVAASAGKWTDAHLQAGCAKICVELTQNRDLYAQGIPNITAVVKGRMVIDPRISPTERIYTDNLALCANDFLTDQTYGFGAVYGDEVNDAQTIASANACDEEVLVAQEWIGVSIDDATSLVTLVDSKKVPITGDGVRFQIAASPASVLPNGITAGVTYYAIRANETSFYLASSLSAARAGTRITLGGSPAAAGDLLFTVYSEPRYRADGTFKLDANPQETLGVLLGAGAGKAVNVGGKWFIFVGAYETPTVTIDEGDLIGPIRVQSLVSRRDSCNGVKGLFTDPNSLYQPTSFPAVASNQYKTEDGGVRIWSEIDVSAFVLSGRQSQRLAKIRLLELRQGLTVVASYRLAAWQAMTGRTVSQSNTKFGWSGKAFEITQTRFTIADDGALGVELTMRETTSAIYDWSTNEESPVDPAPNSNLLDIYSGLSVANLTAESGTSALFRQADGTIVVRVRVRWDAVASPIVSQYEVQFERLSSSPTEWIDEPKVLTPKTETFIYGANDGETVNIRVRARTSFGNAGEWTYIYGHTVVGKTEPPSDVTGLSAVQTGESIVFSVNEVTDADLDLIEIRYGALGSTDWGSMIAVTNILRGTSTTSAAVPPGTWTFGAKARDTSGNYSTNMDTFDLTVSAFGKIALESVTYAPFHDGVTALTNMVRHWTGVLTPDSQSLASALDWEVFDQAVPNAYADCYAEFPQIDTAGDGPARAWATISSALSPGETAGGGGASFEFDYRLAAGSYAGFASWTVGMATFRYCKGRVHVDTSVDGVVVVSEVQIDVDTDAIREDGTLTVDVSGNGAVVFSTTYRSTPVLQLTPQGTGDVSASYASLTNAGFTGYFKTAGVASAGTMSYTATGA